MPARKKLLELRDTRNWTQQQAVDKLEEKTGITITKSYYGMIEQGKRTPSLMHAKAIADLYDTTIEIIFCQEDNQKLTNTA